MTLHALWDVSAPAKLNTFLHVVGRRADGHHLLQSRFVLIDWAEHADRYDSHDRCDHRPLHWNHMRKVLTAMSFVSGK